MVFYLMLQLEIKWSPIWNNYKPLGSTKLYKHLYFYWVTVN